MTDPDFDGAEPPRTRAERQAEKSRSARRRARKNARRARDERAAEEIPTPQVDADLAESAPTPPEPPGSIEPEPAPAESEPAEPEPEPSPAEPETVEPEPPAPVDPELTRRERRQRKRGRRRRPRSAPAVADATIVGTGPEAPVADSSIAHEPIDEAPVEVAAPKRPKSPKTRKTSPEGRRPSTRSAPRRRARSAADQAERRVFWTRTMPIIAGVLALAVVVGVVVRATDDSESAAPGSDAAAKSPEADTLLLVHHSLLFGNDLIALVGRDGRRGSVLLVPSSTQLDVPSLGVATLGQVPVDDGGARIANSVENVIGVDIGKTIVVDDAALTAMLGPAAPMSVDLHAPVDLLDRDAKYPEGIQKVSAAQATELMGGPQAVDELDRLVTASSVFDAWLERLRDPKVAQATRADQADLVALVDAGQAPDHRIDTLGVESIATGGGERFVVREPELAAYVAGAFPSARLGKKGERPRVEILNGTGALGAAQAVADAVVPAGGKVTLTGNLPGFGLPTTQIVYYRDEWREAAQRIVDGMGCGSLRRETRDPKIADVTVLVGFDCPQYGTPGGGN